MALGVVGFGLSSMPWASSLAVGLATAFFGCTGNLGALLGVDKADLSFDELWHPPGLVALPLWEGPPLPASGAMWHVGTCFSFRSGEGASGVWPRALGVLRFPENGPAALLSSSSWCLAPGRGRDPPSGRICWRRGPGLPGEASPSEPSRVFLSGFWTSLSSAKAAGKGDRDGGRRSGRSEGGLPPETGWPTGPTGLSGVLGAASRQGCSWDEGDPSLPGAGGLFMLGSVALLGTATLRRLLGIVPSRAGAFCPGVPGLRTPRNEKGC